MRLRGLLLVTALGSCTLGSCTPPTVPDFYTPDTGMVVVERPDAGHDAGVVVTPGTTPPYQPCATNLDCQSLVCAREVETKAPGGFCLQACDAGVPIDGYRCDPAHVGSSWLQSLCSSVNRCRDGYSCAFDSATDSGYCWPQCSRDSHCPATGRCDLYTKLCEAERDGGSLAAACTRNEDCKSNNCHPASGAAPSFCYTSCNTIDRVCPEGGTCVALFAPISWTDGVCVRRCEDGGTCRGGFRCSVNGNCLPNW